VSVAAAADLPRNPIEPPEPTLTPAAMIARATALRGLLRGAQNECEAQGRVCDAINNELIRAGFYRVIQPRCFGGYEFDVPTFHRVMMEIARGCTETGWVVALTAGHPLILANFPLEGQRELYGASGELRCPVWPRRTACKAGGLTARLLASGASAQPAPSGRRPRTAGAWRCLAGRGFSYLFPFRMRDNAYVQGCATAPRRNPRTR
jgi:hypothetical protein